MVGERFRTWAFTTLDQAMTTSYPARTVQPEPVADISVLPEELRPTVLGVQRVPGGLRITTDFAGLRVDVHRFHDPTTGQPTYLYDDGRTRLTPGQLGAITAGGGPADPADPVLVELGELTAAYLHTLADDQHRRITPPAPTTPDLSPQPSRRPPGRDI